LKLARDGNGWAAYHLWESYARGSNGVEMNPAEADKWLRKFVQDVWVVKLEPGKDFNPICPEEYLARIDHYAPTYSGQTNLGISGFFRTTRHGDKLSGSFLSNYPDQLKARLEKVPGLEVLSVERMTPETFIQYERSPQESF
jgi:hypothetical protein